MHNYLWQSQRGTNQQNYAVDECRVKIVSCTRIMSQIIWIFRVVSSMSELRTIDEVDIADVIGFNESDQCIIP